MEFQKCIRQKGKKRIREKRNRFALSKGSKVEEWGLLPHFWFSYCRG